MISSAIWDKSAQVKFTKSNQTVELAGFVDLDTASEF